MYFNKHNKKKLQRTENELLLKKIMMLLYRRYGTIKMKLKLVPLFFKYYPGLKSFANLLMQKIKRNKMLIIPLHIFDFHADLCTYFPVLSGFFI
jgi:hypothetical protein